MIDQDPSERRPAPGTGRAGHTERVWALVGAYGPSVTSLCRAGPALMPEVDGLGLSAGTPRDAERPRPPIRFSSDAASAQLEALQYVFDEGPCRDAPVLSPDLTTGSWRQRWPRFTEGALDAGARAVHALPLHAGGVHHGGAVDLYRHEPGPWPESHQDEAAAFAAATAELLTLERHGLDLADAFTRARRPAATAPPAAERGSTVLLIRWFGYTLVPVLRREIRTLSAQQGMHGVDLYRFVLAVHAALTNVIRHGGGLGQLLMWRCDGMLHCEISDHGPGIPEAALTLSRTPSPDTDWSTGWGLALIRRACTSLDITTDPTGTRLLLGYRLT